MPSKPASGLSAPAHDAIGLALIEAGLDLLAEGGGAEFSLRAVSERIGSAGSAASHRFGNRAGLIDTVCNAALAREEREFQRFAADLPSLPVAVNPLAMVVREWLDQRTRWSRRQARTVCELLLMAYRDPAARHFGRRYLELCSSFVAKLCPGISPAGAELIALFLVAEAPNWLVLSDDTGFKMLSGETAARVVSVAIGADANHAMFWLENSLFRDEPALANLSGAPSAPGSKGRIVEAVADLIESEGAQAVTHRAAAARAAVSLSSLIHHFGKRTDLMRAGLQDLFRRRAEAGGGDSPAAAALAPYELALHALSDPFLAPLTAAVRRQQGAVQHREANYRMGLAGRARFEVVALLAGSSLLLDAEDSPALRLLDEMTGDVAAKTEPVAALDGRP